MKAQVRYAEIQTRYNVLESQLKNLGIQYNDVIANLSNNENELNNLRQIVKKTEK